MVAFARARAKSIFSKLLSTDLSKKNFDLNKQNQAQELSLTKKEGSSYFLEAIKQGGIWLS